ncbi:MAG: hydrogen gas-evolving membrane-bound hydrogenase subunit E [Spirochaetota bacterium]|nr:hydrogen gas-evolving membrane-bound hydrogenase subunit E [Spirochaetota bacterium]
MRKLLSIIIILIAGGVLVYGVNDFPKWADPDQPASTHVSPKYIEEIYEKTAVPNMVTAVLADYRGYDTMFETAVIFTAGIAVVMLLRRRS